MIYLLQVSICWIVLYGIYMLFLQKETFFTINRYYLLSALLAGLMIPFLGGYLPANSTSTEIYQVMSQVSTIEITPQEEQIISIFNWLNFLYLIYSVGAFIVFSRFAYGLYRIFNIYKNAHKTKHKNYTLVESSKFHLPFSFFHFIFISKELPLNKDVKKVLRHEELHVHQWHSIDIVITELLQVFFWFNPILIFYKSAFRQSHEFLADAYVTQDHNRSSYGQLLLRQSTSGLEIALANHFFHSQIKKRITMLYKEKSKRPAMVKYLLAIPVLIGLIVLFASNKSAEPPSNINLEDCMSITISEEGQLLFENEQMEFIVLANRLKKETKDCIVLDIENQKYNELAVLVHYLANKSNMEVHLAEVNDESQFLKDVLNPSLLKSDSENFEGRKIIQRSSPHELNGKSLNGNITINTEADKAGNMIFVEVLKDQSSITDKEVLITALSLAKKYKIEPGETTVKGTIIFNVIGGAPIGSLVEGSKNLFGTKKKLDLTAENQGDPIFKVVEVMPRFPGCEELNGTAKEKESCAKQKMLEFIYKNIKYPAIARNMDIQGTCVVQFVVDKDGSISNGKIVRDIGADCGNESLRVVNTMPTWTPGKQKGEVVRVRYTLPVRFKLEGKSSAPEKRTYIVGGNTNSISLGEINLGRDLSKGSIQVRAREEILTEGTDYSIDYNTGKLTIINKTLIQKEIPINVTFGEQSEQIKKHGLAINKDQTSHNLSGDDLFIVVDEMPRFPGCEDSDMSHLEKDKCSWQKMLEFIYANLKYPKEARNNGIKGVAVIQMIIEKDGSVTSSKIIRDPGAGTGTEAKRVVDAMPTWIPGKQRGKTVRVQYTLPIKYKLEGDEQSSVSSKNKILYNSLLMTKDDFRALANIESLVATTGLSLDCKIKE